MKTRGKTKVTNPDYSKNDNDARDAMDDGTDTNGFAEDKINEPTQVRGDNRTVRNGGQRRPAGRNPRAGGTRAKADKQIMESAEFREVVQGFFDFIEEINKRRGKPRTNKVKSVVEAKKPKLTEEPEPRKQVKHNPEYSQNRSIEKSDQALAASPIDPSKADRNDLYRHPPPQQSSNLPRFNPEGKEIFDLMRDKNKEQINLPSNDFPKNQEPKAPSRVKNETAAPKEQLANKSQYAPGPVNFNSLDYLTSLQHGVNLQDINQQLLLKKFQANQAGGYGGYDNNNSFSDLMKRLHLQNMTEQNPLLYLPPPFDNRPKLNLESFGVKPNNELLNMQMIDALLQKSHANLLGTLLATPQGTAALLDNFPRELPYMLSNINQTQQQRFGNQSLGAELIQNDPEVINPKNFEGKLGRAATHVAIAYFIYFKSLDPDAITKSDKSKMDPTYNARMLKEKKYESFGNENSMVNKLLPPGFESRLGLGSGFSLDSFQAQDLQRLLAQQGLSEQLQLQKLQQEALLRNEELNKQKNDIKVEEEKAEAQRRKNKQNKPMDEIIEIKENSDTEMDIENKNQQPAGTTEVKEEKIEPEEAANKPAEAKQQQMIPEESKSRDAGKEGTVNVEDIVEEITELTNPNSSDQDKSGNKKRPKPNRKAPAASPGAIATSKTSDQATKPHTPTLPVQKTFADEGDNLVQTHNNRPKPSPQKNPDDQKIQVISSDEAAQSEMKEEITEKKPEITNQATEQPKGDAPKPQE